MIKQKKKKCKTCGEMKYIFSKGKCEFCANSNTLLKQTPIKKSKSFIKPVTVKKQKEKKEESEKRNKYFDYHIRRCNQSEESFKPITNPNRSNICHLIDKGRHPSLEDNLDNYIYLTFTEHERFDQLLYSHRFEDLEKEFKNSWKKVCTRIKYLLSLCQENTVFTRAVKKYLDGK